jgi:hypothetical protein
LTKKKEISFERYDRKKYHIFVIILVFPKENQIVFVGGEIWVVEFVKKKKIGGSIVMAYSEIFKYM